MLTRTLFNFPATNTEVGPSAPPIIAIALLFIFNATPTITDIIPTIPATIPNIFFIDTDNIPDDVKERARQGMERIKNSQKGEKI